MDAVLPDAPNASQVYPRRFSFDSLYARLDAVCLHMCLYAYVYMRTHGQDRRGHIAAISIGDVRGLNQLNQLECNWRQLLAPPPCIAPPKHSRTAKRCI